MFGYLDENYLRPAFCKSYTYNSKTQPLWKRADELGITADALYRRLRNKNWTYDRCFSKKQKRYPYKGQEYTLRQLQNITGIERHVLWHRYNDNHYADDDEYTMPLKWNKSTKDQYYLNQFYEPENGCLHNSCFECPYEDCVKK